MSAITHGNINAWRVPTLWWTPLTAQRSKTRVTCLKTIRPVPWWFPRVWVGICGVKREGDGVMRLMIVLWNGSEAWCMSEPCCCALMASLIPIVRMVTIKLCNEVGYEGSILVPEVTVVWVWAGVGW